jgi:hypothetical protein
MKQVLFDPNRGKRNSIGKPHSWSGCLFVGKITQIEDNQRVWLLLDLFV